MKYQNKISRDAFPSVPRVLLQAVGQSRGASCLHRQNGADHARLTGSESTFRTPAQRPYAYAVQTIDIISLVQTTEYTEC